jgi:hypothetical protein
MLPSHIGLIVSMVCMIISLVVLKIKVNYKWIPGLFFALFLVGFIVTLIWAIETAEKPAETKKVEHNLDNKPAIN